MAKRIFAAVARRIRRNILGPLPNDPAKWGRLKNPVPIDLSDHVALVTGATGELGRPMARTLAACGAKVAIHYHKAREPALALRDELIAAGFSACIVSGDVAELDQVSAMRKEIEQTLGPVDIVVNNAVTWFDHGLVADLDADQFHRVFRSSVLQAWATAKIFSGPMIARRWGRIISIGSEASTEALVQRAPYITAKCAMDGLMRTLARELGEHGITVNTVAPGWVITDKDRKDRDEVQPEYERNVPLRRRGYDQDVAHLIAFLASDLANFITGVRIPVCGGHVMLEP